MTVRSLSSTLDILVRDFSACHERRGKPRRTRMSIVRSLSSTPPTLRSLDLFRLRLLTRRGTQGQAKAEVGAAERPPESNQMATVGGVSAVPWTFLSEIPQLATNEGRSHDGQECPSYGRFPQRYHGSAHLSCAASGDLTDGELRARRKPLPS